MPGVWEGVEEVPVSRAVEGRIAGKRESIAENRRCESEAGGLSLWDSHRKSSYIERKEEG